jgi:phosphohistidine phosphatase SixA
MQRRTVLIAASAWTLGAQAAPTLAERARQGGVLLIRHASTEPGLGDPAGFSLGQCSTQRNLSAQGRAEARAMGAWFKRHRLEPQAVLSSQWCRCQDTARLALERAQDWSALNSTFAGQGQPDRQLSELRERLQRLPAGVLEVWITHQVIMTALTQAYPAMGEGFLVDRQGQLLARGMMTADV